MFIIYGPRLQDADSPPAGDPPATPPPAAAAPPTPDPEVERLRIENEKLQRAQKKREEEERKAADEKRQKEEGSAALLKERSAELEKLRAQNEKLVALEKDRAEKIFGALPEASQKKLEAIKESIELDAYVRLLEAERDQFATSDGKPETPAPPPTGSPTPPKKGPDMGAQYKPSEDVARFFNETDPINGARKLEALKSVHFEGNESSGANYAGFGPPTLSDDPGAALPGINAMIKQFAAQRAPIGQLVKFKDGKG